MKDSLEICLFQVKQSPLMWGRVDEKVKHVCLRLSEYVSLWKLYVADNTWSKNKEFHQCPVKQYQVARPEDTTPVGYLHIKHKLGKEEHSHAALLLMTHGNLKSRQNVLCLLSCSMRKRHSFVSIYILSARPDVAGAGRTLMNGSLSTKEMHAQWSKREKLFSG